MALWDQTIAKKSKLVTDRSLSLCALGLPLENTKNCSKIHSSVIFLMTAIRSKADYLPLIYKPQLSEPPNSKVSIFIVTI
jgi:hypothetical protein